MDWQKVTAELSKKLDPAHVQPAKAYGPKGDYIEGWHAMSEANRIFGFDGWDYDIAECKCVSERPKKIGKDGKDGWAVSYIASVLVMAGGTRRKDVGAGHGYDLDCGLAHESAIKEAVTDALKRALRSYGNPFGLALYDKSRENVGVDAPQASPYEIELAVRAINSAAGLDDLAAVWKQFNANLRHVAEALEVIAAKDARKAELSKGKAA